MPKTNTPQVTERRRWKRVPVDVRVKLLIAEGNGEKVIHGRSTVIAEGGMGVTLTRELPKGTVATLVFSLPGEKAERSFQALLKYRSGFHCGFEFTGITPEQQRELRSFCMQTAKKG
ncbi:MAG: PilZ domain-containing protein [Candidatus Korobacteraceae bacterium]